LLPDVNISFASASHTAQYGMDGRGPQHQLQQQQALIVGIPSAHDGDFGRR
jgi:hypothetical protein